jgi:photosystem II stability/assembly factor-like uncharacterized protein
VISARFRALVAGLTLALAMASCDGDDGVTGTSGRALTQTEVVQILQLVPVAVAELADFHSRVVQAARGDPVEGVVLTDLGGDEFEAQLEWDLDGDGVLESVVAATTVTLDGEGEFSSGAISLTDDTDHGVSGSGSVDITRVAGSVDNPTYRVTSGTFTIDAREAPESNPFHGSVVSLSTVDGSFDLTYSDAPVLSGSLDFEFANASGTVVFEPDGVGGWLTRISGFLGSAPFVLTDDSPSRGAIKITTSTIGEPTDTDGYELTVAGETETIEVDDSVTFLGLPPGDYSVSLGDIAPDCSLRGDNPRSVSVVRGSVARISFSLRCGDAAFAWQVQSSGLDSIGSHLRGVSFVDANTGWEVGCCLTSVVFPVVLHTADGAMWTRQEPDAVSLKTLRDVHFTDADTGMVVGSDGVIMRTENGGATWRALPTNNRINYMSVSFVDGMTGWVLGSEKGPPRAAVIWRTTDGADTWIGDTIPGWLLEDIFFLDSETGWTVGREESGDPLVLRSTDGGQNWLTPEIAPADCVPYAVDFVDADNGWAVGEKRGGGTSVVRTIDGGRTWTDLSQNLPVTSGRRAMDVSFFDAMIGTIVLADGRIYRTEDGGTFWIEEVNEALGAKLEAVQMVDATTAVAVGELWLVTREATIVRRQ